MFANKCFVCEKIRKGNEKKKEENKSLWQEKIN